MVIHHPARLHEGVYRGGTDEFEASLFELFCDFVGYLSVAGGVAVVGYIVYDSFAADFVPEVSIKRAILSPDVQK